MTRSLLWQMVIVLGAILMVNYVLTTLTPQTQEPVVDVSYSRFKTELAADNVAAITFEGNNVVGNLRERTILNRVEGTEEVQSFLRFRTTMPPVTDTRLLDDLEQRKVDVKVRPESKPSPWATAMIYMLPWLLIVGVWWFVIKGMRTRQGPGGGMMGGFSKSGAKMYTKERSRVTFADVAGLDEAKQELMEIIEFLRNPKKFMRLGAKAPRGVLLVGPPGTGKTLMARAVAGEAEVPFFTISASQFIEMFVGVGASRVRDLFNNAKKNAPSIIFIDELDAVGRSRGTGLGGGNDEREQTLNQLLSEMDGFEAHDEVIVMSATNRPDVLDPALLRPGRFDRQVTVERPDWRAREEILKVHTRQVPIDEDVDLQIIARSTPGMCGADLENLVNEAALIAARENAQKVTMQHFEQAKDRVLMGTERKLVMSQQEKRITAYHEAGHTLLARLSPGADPIHKVSIIPRGQALGVTQQLPVDDRYHYSRSYLMTRIAVSLGGRAAEKAIFEEYSTGAQNDLKQATDLAEKMVCQWGMSERVGPMSINRGEEHPFLGRKLASDNAFSQHMAWIIDQEIEKVVKAGEQAADEIIANHLPVLKKLADALLEEEVLDRTRVDEVLRETGIEVQDDPAAHPDGDHVLQGELAGGAVEG
ncbi:cell division ATP-dependent zinc protease FtsH [Syntrophotalea carbinolica DSM 2380]|uniref:ATP-dependent zinc metalloprotease FtsH n=1 Tax=Syntrophotalea carbinolica (strain DSM 2380 / NBRC 103641 / GraBd1) TaxID=338963 RepID=FTSH_SYNC1|nr:ATP-dependent zinc metalloprotease FtsH [Syntrophotalea carbinolica]Q3A579.1 RecName: Full=ATP-dependent zinc metalloprotease FtsH [Syntrophotalea carbinolica DSM 2380]ABA88478.1 cell division ATP-dependent zinc protease FtsH [Syntrophotalea carbinolica DSM 2380]